VEPLLKVISSCNYAGSTSPSEDAVGWTDTSAWMIDGATSFGVPDTHRQYDVRWLVDLLNTELAIDDETQSVTETLARLAKKVDTELTSCRFPSDAVPPSGAIGLVRLRDTKLEWAILGDVVLVIGLQDNSCIVASDWEIARREEQMIAASATMTPFELTHFGSERRIRDMNRDGGYWILSRSTTAADHAIIGNVLARDVASILMMTDGFSRCVDTLSIYDQWEHLLSDIRNGASLAAIGAEIRLRERDDQQRLKYSRLKISDDAAALHLHVVG
jgi:hypothetical protein